MAFSLGGSRSSSNSSSKDEVFGASNYLGLFSQASHIASRVDTGNLEEQGKSLFTGGLGAIQSLLGETELDQYTSQYLQGRMNGEGSTANEQIANVGDDIGRFFNQQIMPGIASKAIGAGQLGGGRQGVAEGMAVDAVGREFSNAATNIRTADMAMRDQAANASIAYGANRNAAASSALSAIPNVNAALQSYSMSGLAPYYALSDILGNPTVLNESKSRSSSTSLNLGVSAG